MKPPIQKRSTHPPPYRPLPMGEIFWRDLDRMRAKCAGCDDNDNERRRLQRAGLLPKRIERNWVDWG